MPEEQSVKQLSKSSTSQLHTQAVALERKMRLLKRNITGLSSMTKEDLVGDELGRFQSRLTMAKGYWKDFQELWDQRDSLHIQIGDTDTFPDEQWEALYDKLLNEICTADGIMITIQKQHSRASSPSPDHTVNRTLNTSSRPLLPKIAIPHFSGDLLQWTHFRDTYLSMVHNQPDLSNVEKFHYLIGVLEGEANSLISKFPVSEVAYEQAWSKVLQTYDNPRVLANMLIHRIIDCEVGSAKSESQRYDRFLTCVADSVDSFRALNLENPCEFILSTLALRALDSQTRKQFELSLDSAKGFPNVEDVITFVRQRQLAVKMSRDIHSLNPSTSNRSSPSAQYPNRFSSKYKAVSFHTARESSESESGRESLKPRSTKQCQFCKGSHYVSRCADFFRLPPNKRSDMVHSWRVCYNCLAKGHKVGNCRSRFRCKYCKGKHHTLVHRDEADNSREVQTAPGRDDGLVPLDGGKTFTGFGSSKPTSTVTVLLGTVRVLVEGHRGELHSVHAILDSGSQHTFMTSSLARRLGARISPSHVSIIGLAESAVSQSLIKGTTQCVIRPYTGDKEFRVTPLIIECITTPLPNRTLPTSITDRLKHLPLADNQFGQPKTIDLLIGADIYHKIITGASRYSGIEDLSLIPTEFGLVVTGIVKNMSSVLSHSFFIESGASLDDQLKAFWEIEEPPPVEMAKPEDAFCEEFYVKTHLRNSEGRYIVKMPIKEGHGSLGDNRDIAHRRFYALEAKFKRNPLLFEKYAEFMQEYINLGHMSLSSTRSSYLIPHHAVWQEAQDGNMKLRVVFDASCSSSSSHSLNDLLLTGPKLQDDLRCVLIGFRLYAIPLRADIIKMYRQVLMHEGGRHYQHILWRNSPSDAIEEYELNTITYGVKPSSYLAIRSVMQLVKDEGSKFPLAAKRVLTDMVVDDICTGADSLEEAVQLQAELIELFSKGGFKLSKWASNEPTLVPEFKEEVKTVPIQLDDFTKILGLVWNLPNDSFSYAVKSPPTNVITKRSLLSSISRIFDPLGLLAPVILVAKALIQEIWKAGCDWDESLSHDLRIAWLNLTADWSMLPVIKVPRCVTQPGATRRMVGFCDASSKGYGAAIYLHSEGVNGKIKVVLLMAKSKVAPLKYTSIARLELNGAVLLSRLISAIPQHTARSVTCFSDSQVVLCWLRSPSHKLKVYEANRVSQVTCVVPAHRWQYVSSEDNPADLASRGCHPAALKDSSLWWSGPTWLHAPASSWLDVETDVSFVSLENDGEPLDYDWTTTFSSFVSMVKNVAKILRLVARKRNSSSALFGPISPDEFREAELRCAGFSQRFQFPPQVFKGQIPRTYAQLFPFVDERGIIRVGGRLNNAPLDYSARHPILLPRQSCFARLVVDHIHETNFHAGPSLTLALLRSKYWIPSAYKFIRGRIIRCVHCRTLRARPQPPFMSALPRARFDQFRAFSQVGVDYAGPFMIKESQRRNASLDKAYLCLFVCLASKAVHLELVSSLSTPAFLDSLDRFISRRGVPNTIWSDHGSNFVGASRFLKDVFTFQRNKEPEVAEKLAPRGIAWKFIPPRAPHFGGLWEAGVKSAKRLLSNSLGKLPLTYEQLATALAKVEFLLNSRPLCPLTEDVQDFNFLTPGHFLIGAPLAQLPVAPIESCLPAWKSLQTQISSIWKRWRKDYLHSLQVRKKWTKNSPPLNTGDLVILLERRPLLGQWPVGRVTKTYPGRDGVTRVVEVLTPSGKSLTRAVTSLVPLFHPELEDQSEN